MIQVPDEALLFSGSSLTIRVRDVPVTDVFTFFNPLPPSGHVPAVLSFAQTYTRTGSPRTVTPASTDPTSAFNWAGEMWMATATCTFAVAYADGSFSARGSASSAGQFSEVGFERNGVFVTRGTR
jgi:hypothetical protein